MALNTEVFSPPFSLNVILYFSLFNPHYNDPTFLGTALYLT